MEKKDILSKAQKYGFEIQLQGVPNRTLYVDLDMIPKSNDSRLSDSDNWIENPHDFYPNQLRYNAYTDKSKCGIDRCEDDLDEDGVLEVFAKWIKEIEQPKLMTIKELKEKLSQYPDDTPIQIQNLETLDYYKIADVQPFNSDETLSKDNPLSIDFEPDEKL